MLKPQLPRHDTDLEIALELANDADIAFAEQLRFQVEHDTSYEPLHRRFLCGDPKTITDSIDRIR
jgi:hypothetical protein